MSTKTNIAWTDVTDNIIVAEGGGWWCRMISPGCANCYAASLNQNSFYGGNHLPYSGEPPKLKLREDVIDGWKRQRNPKRHFVASMTDVFGHWIPFAWAVRFLRGMWCAPRQTFQILTKRPDVMRRYIADWLQLDGLTEVPSNIWVGTSVEDQQRADERIPILREIPARVRFLSVEPMLEDINIGLQGIHWVIFGGESGPKARPCNIDHIRAGVRQCRKAGVAVFVKQLGAIPFTEGREGRIRCEWVLKHPKGSEMSEWPNDIRVQEFPNLEAAAA